MNTFLPYADFTQSARCLDRQRLGKQRLEAAQMLNTILGISDGWARHPCTRLWAPFPGALARYGLVVCDEWIRRGYTDNLRQVFEPFVDDTTPPFPDALHLSHQSNLIRKLPAHYRPLWPDVPDNLPYVWSFDRV